MILKSIFHKPVDRPIEGVIKADDEASLRQEIEEYVLTNEVAKSLEDFLDAYNNYQVVNGAWISGFFGSGKSHLLKMLALLLENREIEGGRALDLFLPKCGDNEILRGDIRRAASIPSRSILFNIDQKADVISKAQVDALLAVFVKVFDEMCGYYGKQGHIAQFERDLDSRNLYGKFKDAYQAIAGKEWSRGREQALLEGTSIARAYAQATGEPEETAKGILARYQAQYRVSIEDFAEQVMAFIDRQPPSFRLNFFVDEVGQYIAQNVKLMTNLQTIAESLATKCRGRAWVIVTAQEDMNTVVGEMSRQQSHDFSKIQARFARRMKLTSADVAEVIQKRLLLKNETGVNLLSDIYHDQSNNFKTLFDFADGSKTYRNYRDRDHFIHSYPFIPYQYTLFQTAIQSLSQHNAFEGKHSSVGERSMLAVFQQVAIQVSAFEIGQLATFDLMFEGIRSALKSNIQRAILTAEQNLDNPFAVSLLKALFLVKYIREFRTTPRNLSVLMVDRFQRDVPELRKHIEEALNLLEQQTYIQRTGENYEYLTDEEKDVEQEIKNTDVEMSDVSDELEKVVFDHILNTRKIRYDRNGQDYVFSRKMDGNLRGRELELAIHLITPFNPDVENLEKLLMHSFQRDELLVVMPPDARLVGDFLLYKRTEKYIRQNFSSTQQETTRRILTDKGSQNRERLNELQLRIQESLLRAKIYVAGKEIVNGGADPKTRLMHGFCELIGQAFPNLRMLREITYSENDILKILKGEKGGLLDGQIAPLSEPEQELLAFIQGNNRSGVRTTVKSMLEKFEHKPYGWPYPAVLCILAHLCARGKVEVRSDANLLEDAELERGLRNTTTHGNLILDPQVDFTPSQVRNLKDFHADFFDSPPTANEARALGKETGEAMTRLVTELTQRKADAVRFPFLNGLSSVVDKLKALCGKPYAWYLTELSRQTDELLDLKESLLDPLHKFMNGPQREIYAEAAKFLQEHESNLDDLGSEDPATLRSLMENPDCFRGDHMQKVKILAESLRSTVTARIEQEVGKARESLDTLKTRLRAVPEYAELLPEAQRDFEKPFEDLAQGVGKYKLIAVIRDTVRRFEEKDYPKLLEKLSSKPRTEHVGDGTAKPETPPENPSAPPPRKEPKVRPFHSIRVPFDNPLLKDETDVNLYLEILREALIAEIRQGKIIQV